MAISYSVSERGEVLKVTPPDILEHDNHTTYGVRRMNSGDWHRQ